jgi:hypothetical protein
MQGVAKILIVLLMLVALPLRGYAAIAAELCHEHHGGLPATDSPAYVQAADDSGDSHSGGLDHSGFASVCGHCASCCVGASLAPDESRQVAFAPAGASAIPFHGSSASGRVPDILDRPPLAL